MSKVATKAEADFNAAVKKGDMGAVQESIERLSSRLDRVALVNCCAASGSTPLFTVCWDGRLDMCQLLLEHGGEQQQQ
jgi:ankyrin repeat protein